MRTLKLLTLAGFACLLCLQSNDCKAEKINANGNRLFFGRYAKSIKQSDCDVKSKIKNWKPLKDSVYIDTNLTHFFQRKTGWIASDGALTVPLKDGRVLWLMGDSHIDDYDPVTGTIPCLFQVRNCALLQPRNDWNWEHTVTLTGNGPGFKSLFKLNPSDTYFSWPGSGVQIGDTVYVYSSNLKMTGGGAFGWASGGLDMWAKIKYPEMKKISYSPLQDFAGIGFGFSMIKDDATGYVYVYGSKLKTIAGDLYIARFPISNPNAKWEFWDGKEWDKNIAKIATIGQAPSTSISICKIKDKYVVVSSQFSVGCDQGKDIYVQTSSSITGPFSKPKTIYTIPDNNKGHSPFFYAVEAHPEYINAKNELLITYDINGYNACVPDCVNGRSNPDIYRPRGIRVLLKIIDQGL